MKRLHENILYGTAVKVNAALAILGMCAAGLVSTAAPAGAAETVPISGSFTTASGTPVAGALIGVIHKPDASWGTLVANLTTDASGAFSASIAPGDYFVTTSTKPPALPGDFSTSTSRPSYLSINTGVFHVGESGFSLELRVPEVTTVTVRLEDADGVPLSTSGRGTVSCARPASAAPIETTHGYSISGIMEQFSGWDGFVTMPGGTGTFKTIAGLECTANVSAEGQPTFTTAPFIATGDGPIGIRFPRIVKISGSIDPGMALEFHHQNPSSVANSRTTQGNTFVAAVPPGKTALVVKTSQHQVLGNQWRLEARTDLGDLQSDQTLNVNLHYAPMTVRVIDNVGGALPIADGFVWCAGYPNAPSGQSDTYGDLAPISSTVPWSSDGSASVVGRIGQAAGAGNSIQVLPGMGCHVEGLRLADGRSLPRTHTVRVWEGGTALTLAESLGFGAATPPKTPDVTSVQVGDHSATINWLKADSELPILGYTVTASPGGRTCSTDSPDELSCTITGLDNGVNYTFTVTARNAVGSSPAPTNDPCTTCNAVVGPVPDPVRISDGGVERSEDGTKATVVWLAAAAKDPALPIVGYLVTATSSDDPDSHTCRTDGALSCTVEGLVKGLDYTLTVQALTGAGASPVTKPGAPSEVVAILGSGQSVKLVWAAPAVDGGTPITGYTVTASGDGGSCTTSATLSCTIKGLTRGANYRFAVVATNAKGDSDPSAPSNEVTIPTDTTAPVVRGSADREADTPGWYRAPVTVSWSATDDTDGELGAPAPVGVGEGADQTVASHEVCDSAGNCATGSFGPLSVDLTKPTIQASVSGSANGAGWRNEAPVVSYECADALSGVAECPRPETVGDGRDQTVTGTVTDRAGNTDTAKVSGLNVDTGAPEISGRPAIDVPASGWFSGDVPIAWSCSDDLSGIAEAACPSTSDLTGEGSELTIAEVATDRAGNTATAQSATVNIDRTAPATGVSAPEGWNASSVSLRLTPIDTLSGVKSTKWTVDGGDAVTGTEVTVTGEGRHMLRFHSVDNAGNAEDPVEVSVLIDSSGPQVVASLDPRPNAQGWNNTPVTVTFTCTDADSGVADCTAPVTVTDEGAGQVIAGEGADAAGNRTLAQATVNLDRTAPTITAGIDATPNAAGWFNSPVPLQWRCSDALSGVSECSEPVVFTEAHPGPVSGDVADVAGNTATSSQSALRIDTTPPVVAINGPEDGAVYTLGSAPVASCAASDALSGLAADCHVDVTGGNANHVGSFTVNATATDGAGNTTVATLSYRVQYGWAGFDQPINDTAHQVSQSVSVFKAGSTIPAKFTLVGANGQSIMPVAAPLWITPAKGVSTTLPVDETVYTDPADSGNTYKDAGGRWAYNWKTDKAQAGYYWRIGVRLDDGTIHYVNIALR